MRKRIVLGGGVALALALVVGVAHARPVAMRPNQVVTAVQVQEAIQAAQDLQTSLQRRSAVVIGRNQQGKVTNLLRDGSTKIQQSQELLRTGEPKLLGKALEAAKRARKNFQTAQILVEDGK